ncbi:hypothetical protein KY338_04060 [Candidatus Woesearchaeota archaeon]|nr:hypothetical protein [Candidatus Woesearchaeota archaeon]MBW3005488.1 hypothetical protein [Candidatus Woesearchaeota archaeon]
MLSESEEMDLHTGFIMQRTINEFYDGNPVEYVHRLWEWIGTVREVWEPLEEFGWKDEYRGVYSLVRNSENPKGMSYAKSKETFPNSLVLVTQFYLYKQVSHDLSPVKEPEIIPWLDMTNSRRFWRIVRKEEAVDEPLEAKLERFAEKKPPKDRQLPESINPKSLRQITTSIAYQYLFDTTLRKLYIEYEMKGLTEKLEFLMEKYGVNE